jgi:hypothetical protein
MWVGSDDGLIHLTKDSGENLGKCYSKKNTRMADDK